MIKHIVMWDLKHLKVKEFVKNISTNRKVIDFEV